MKGILSSILVYSGSMTDNVSPASKAGYIIGLVFAILVLGYLIYTLIRPEKF